MHNANLSFFKSFTNAEVLDTNVLHLAMVFWVLCNSNCRLVVDIECQCTRNRVAEFLKKIAKEHELQTCKVRSNVLCFSSRTSNKWLQLRRPRHNTRTYFD